MVDGIAEIVLASLAKSSLAAYKKTWVSFTSFLSKFKFKDMYNPSYVLLYLYTLAKQGLAPATITSKVS